jgi:hypothetical protein
VVRYVEPESFARYEREGQRMGFQFVASGPLVRSSYHAAEAFVAARVPAGEGAESGPRPVVQPSDDAAPFTIPRREEQLIPAAGLVRR